MAGLPMEYAERLMHLGVLFRDGHVDEAFAAGDVLLRDVVGRYGDGSPQSGVVVIMLGHLYYAAGRLGEAEQSYSDALSIYRQTRDDDPESLITALDNLAKVYVETDRVAQGIPLFREALDVVKASPPGEPTALASRQVGLALIEFNQGNMPAGEELLCEAAAAWPAVIGDPATGMSNLALQLREAGGQTAAAEVALRLAGELREELLGPEHPDVATDLNALAIMYEQAGEYARELPLLERALAIRRKAFGTDSVEVLQVLNNLGGANLGLRQFADARRWLQEALDIRRRLLGDMDPGVGQSLEYVARTYSDAGEYAEAAPIYAQALDVAIAVHPDDSEEISRLSRTVLICLMEAGDWRGAIPFAERDLERRRRLFGDDHVEVASMLSGLSKMHFELKEYGPAERYLQQALEIQRKALGDDDPAVQTTIDSLQRVLLPQGNYAAMEPILRLELEIRRRTRGEDHVEFADTLGKLALVAATLGDANAAAPLFEQARKAKPDGTAAEDSDFAGTLKTIAAAHQRNGKFAAAESLFRHALDIQRRTLPADAAELASTLESIADACMSLANYGAAEPVLREAVEIRRAGAAANPAPLLVALLELADALRSKGAQADAKIVLDEVLAMRDREFEGRDFVVARALTTYAAVMTSLSDFAAAESAGQEGLELRQRLLGAEHHGCAFAWTVLADMYRAKGDYQKSRECYLAGIGLLERGSQQDTTDYATALNNLAGLRRAMGDYAAAETDYLRVLEIRRRIRGETHPETAEVLNNLGLLYLSWGRLTPAERSLTNAIAILRQTGSEAHPVMGRALSNLANLQFELNNVDAAAALYAEAAQRIKDLYGPDHVDYGYALHNLASIYRQRGDLEQAAPLLLQANELLAAKVGRMHPMYATNLNNLAELHWTLGQAEPALHMLEAATEIARASLGPRHPDFAGYRFNLARHYEHAGNHAAAEPLFREALDIYREALGDSHDKVAQALMSLALLSAATGREHEALGLMTEAQAIHDAMIDQVFAIVSEKQRLDYLANLHFDFARTISLAVRFPALGPAAIPSALDLVLRRKGITAEVLASQRQAILSGRYPQLAGQLSDLVTLRTQIAERALAGPGAEGKAEHERILAEWNARRNAMDIALSREIPELQLERQSRRVDRRMVAQALPPDAVLIELLQTLVFDFSAGDGGAWEPPHYLAFVMPADDPDRVTMIDLGYSALVHGAIDAFRTSIGGGDRQLTADSTDPAALPFADVGRALRSAVFDPLIAALEGRTRLLIAPDGNLAQLPFEALPVDEGGYLIDRYRISYLSTGREALRATAASTAESSPPVVVADPDFELRRDVAGAADADEPTDVPSRRSRDLRDGVAAFGRLPATKTEGEEVGRVLAVTPLMAGDALERRLKSCRSPKVLHLATHGFFLPEPDKHAPGAPDAPVPNAPGRLQQSTLENPLLRCGLALAGANAWLRGEALPDEAEDGILTAEDVSGLDLLGTELVVLSACETGLGQMSPGEGLFGFRRVFSIAGARTLVMSLWKVPDAQTQQLMVEFYRRLRAGEARADALRGAQLAVKANYPEALYWGAFICQGDAGGLQW